MIEPDWHVVALSRHLALCCCLDALDGEGDSGHDYCYDVLGFMYTPRLQMSMSALWMIVNKRV